MRILPGVVRLAILILVLLENCSPAESAPVSPDASGTPRKIDIKLNDYLQRVLRQNQTLQAQMFGAEASRDKWKAEYGIFEPKLLISATREGNRRLNNLEQQAALANQSIFEELNNLYNTGLESLLPSGGKVRLGFTVSDLNNNVNPYGNIFTTGSNNIFTRQYETFAGFTFTQPLLKNAGTGPTLAALRVAAAESEIGFQQYRRQLMVTVAQAEAAYWSLYVVQEQLQFFDNSVSVAQNVLDDSRGKLKAGQGAELNVMEAQAGLALRETKRNEALQNYYDALGHFLVLAGIFPTGQGADPAELAFRAVDAPPEGNAVMTFADGYSEALALNPDFLIQKEKIKQEELRMGLAKNQMLPELNFKAAYGYNGLGSTQRDSWSAVGTTDYPSWSISLEMTIMLGGDIKGRNSLDAAKMNLREACAGFYGMQAEIANRLSASIRKTNAWHQSIQSYQTVVSYNQDLLKTDFARLKAGTIDGHKVLEVEADLLNARQDLANALMQYQQSQLQVELTSGSILKKRHLEVTREELKHQVAGMVKHPRTANSSVKN